MVTNTRKTNIGNHKQYLAGYIKHWTGHCQRIKIFFTSDANLGNCYLCWAEFEWQRIIDGRLSIGQKPGTDITSDWWSSESANLRQCQKLARDTLSRKGAGNIVSWFNLDTCSTITKMAPLDRTYDFLLVFYSSFDRVSYRFGATLDFIPTWPCWVTATSKWQWRSIGITSKMKSAWEWPKTYFWFLKKSCKSIHNFLREIAYRKNDRRTDLIA